MSGLTWVIILLCVLIAAFVLWAIAIILRPHEGSEASTDESVGRIIINMSDPDKEYFECELYSQAFFKEVHQKETVTFDVEIR